MATATLGLLKPSAFVALWRISRIEAAISRLRRAQAVDPHSFVVAQFLGIALYYQRRWDEARRTFDHALALAPSDLLTLDFRASTWLSEGDSAGARRALADVPATVDRAEYAAYMVHSGEPWLLDQPTLDLLASLGIDHAQGYHIGKPAPLALWLVEEKRKRERAAKRSSKVVSHATS